MLEPLDSPVSVCLLTFASLVSPFVLSHYPGPLYAQARTLTRTGNFRIQIYHMLMDLGELTSRCKLVPSYISLHYFIKPNEVGDCWSDAFRECPHRGCQPWELLSMQSINKLELIMCQKWPKTNCMTSPRNWRFCTACYPTADIN